jgi:hypothetical protein
VSLVEAVDDVILAEAVDRVIRADLLARFAMGQCRYFVP